MKQFALLLAAVPLMCGISACAQKTDNADYGKTLVAYFSATGTTRKVAQKIASVTEGDLFEIKPAVAYTPADLNWRDKASRSSKEMGDSKARPAIKPGPDNMVQYEVVYLGFPIWWDEAPRIVNTFIESHNFEGKTLIPFATSGGSSITNAEKELKADYPKLEWEEGKLLNGASENDIRQWVK